LANPSLLQRKLIDEGHAFIRTKEEEKGKEKCRDSKESRSNGDVDVDSVVCVSASVLVDLIEKALDEEERDIKEKMGALQKIENERGNVDEDDDAGDQEKECEQEVSSRTRGRKSRGIAEKQDKGNSDMVTTSVQTKQSVDLMRCVVKSSLRKLFRADVFLRKVSFVESGPLFYVFKWAPTFWTEEAGIFWQLGGIKRALEGKISRNDVEKTHDQSPILTGTALAWLLQTRSPGFMSDVEQTCQKAAEELNESGYEDEEERRGAAPQHSVVVLSQHF